jgi:hypothetical protein
MADRTSRIPRSAKRQSIRTVATARLVKKYGGKIIVFGPNGVPRDTFKFAEHKAGIIDVLNEGAKAVVDVGLTPVLHQHTGHLHRDARRDLRRDAGRRHALSEIRTLTSASCRKGGSDSGSGGEGLSSRSSTTCT